MDKPLNLIELCVMVITNDGKAYDHLQHLSRSNTLEANVRLVRMAYNSLPYSERHNFSAIIKERLTNALLDHYFPEVIPDRTGPGLFTADTRPMVLVRTSDRKNSVSFTASIQQTFTNFQCCNWFLATEEEQDTIMCIASDRCFDSLKGERTKALVVTKSQFKDLMKSDKEATLDDLRKEIDQHFKKSAEHFAAVENVLNPPKEIPLMFNQKLIREATYVNGADINSLSKEGLFALIAELENKKEAYTKVKTVSKAVKAEIVEIDKAIGLVVTKLDEGVSDTVAE